MSVVELHLHGHRHSLSHLGPHLEELWLRLGGLLVVGQTLESMHMRQDLGLILLNHLAVLLNHLKVIWVIVELLLHASWELLRVHLVALHRLLSHHAEGLPSERLKWRGLLRLNSTPGHVHLIHGHHLAANPLL